jgi:hypothetical protein
VTDTNIDAVAREIERRRIAEASAPPPPPPIRSQWVLNLMQSKTKPADPRVREFVRQHGCTEAQARAALCGSAWIERARVLKDGMYMTDADLAQRAGLPLEVVSNLFDGSNVEFKEDTVRRIAAALRVPTQHLLDPNSTPEPTWAHH